MIIENKELTELFDIRTGNEWMATAKPKPVPKKLFGDLWMEGELAILFADTGKGKSLLAVQIAESIARGKAIEPFAMTATPQKVLYLDFELTDKQFEMRYSAEPKEGKEDADRKHYRFSDRFIRLQLKPGAFSVDESQKLEDRIRRMIEPLVDATDARVLIVDNITYLKRTAEGSRETMPLMKELRRLKETLGLSVLVVAHTPKRDSRRPIDVNDLAGSRLLANYVDNIFAIGQSGTAGDVRYIKHIKGRSVEPFYGSAHVPVYRLTRIDGRFLGFEFMHCVPEIDQLRDIRDPLQWELIEKIRHLSAEGKSIRVIATDLEMAKSKVHRLLKLSEMMLAPPVHQCGQLHSELPFEISREDDEFAGIFDDDDADSMAKRRELYLRDAKKHTDFTEAVSEKVMSPPAVEPQSFKSVHPLMPSGVTMQLNEYGKEIYVESVEDGRPKVWYQVNGSGELKRWEKKWMGIHGSTVTAGGVR